MEKKGDGLESTTIQNDHSHIRQDFVDFVQVDQRESLFRGTCPWRSCPEAVRIQGTVMGLALPGSRGRSDSKGRKNV